MNSQWTIVQQNYLEKRIREIHTLFDFLAPSIKFQGDKVISVGCGTGAEFTVLAEKFKQKIGIDQDSAIIDFCESVHKNTQFIFANYLLYAQKIENNSADLILALDIDTNILPDILVNVLLPKLKKNGVMILTEREDNMRIYGRMLLLPHIQGINLTMSAKNVEIQTFTRFNKEASKEDRDNFVVVVKTIF